MEKKGIRAFIHIYNRKILSRKHSNSYFGFQFRNNLLNSKRSQSSIIVLVLIVLIAIVAVLIVWNLVTPLVKEKGEEVGFGQLTTNLEIEKVVLKSTGVAHITVSRGAGGELDSLKFIFYDENGNSESRDGERIDELAEKDYDFAFTGNGKIKKISVVPVVSGKLGIKNEKDIGGVLEIPDGVVNWWKFENGNFVKYYSDENLNFENEIAVSFWVESNGDIKWGGYEIKAESNKVNFSYPGGSFESANELGDGWGHVVLSIAPAFSKIYVSNSVETFSVVSVTMERELIISGEVDDVMLFNRALFETDVSGLYTYQKR